MRNELPDSKKAKNYLIVDKKCPEKGPIKLPKKPELSKDEIQRLIKSESADVESARCLIAEEKKLFKKPCPKQMKAQSNVKRLVHSHDTHPSECPKEYGPVITNVQAIGERGGDRELI